MVETKKDEKKKYLLVTSFYPPYHVGGACTHVYYLANELAERGNQVHVLFSSDSYRLKRWKKPSAFYPNHPNVILHDVTTFFGSMGPLYSFITGLPFSTKIKKILSDQYDVIHYHNISLFGPKIMSFGKAKKVYTAHDHWLLDPLSDYYKCTKVCVDSPNLFKCSLALILQGRPPQLWRYTSLLKNSLKNIDLLITPSEYLKKFLEKHGIKKKIVVLPNFVPDAPLSTANDKPIPYQNYFFFAGMLEEIKGIEVLLNVFSVINEEVVIAGTGSLRKKVEKVTKTHSNIHYVGWLSREELYRYYRNARCIILPSLCPENCPNVILEAFSVGIPTLGSKTGGIPELLNLISPSFIFQRGSKKDLRKAIKKFSMLPVQRDVILNKFIKHFSKEAYLIKYEHEVMQ